MGCQHRISKDLRYWTLVSESPEVYVLNTEDLNPKVSYTNCFLLHDGSDWLVVDTMLYSVEGSELMLAALDELGAEEGRLSLFLTHAHADHTGLSGVFAGRGARVYVGCNEFASTSAEILPYYVETVLPKAFAEGFVGEDASYFAKLRRIMSPSVEVDGCEIVRVSEGDAITLGDLRLEVIETPGHSPGHISLFERRSGAFFGGDLALAGTAPFVDVSLDGEDLIAAYLGSLEKVRALPVRAYFPSHDGILLDAAPRIDWLLEHHRLRLEEAIGVIAQNPNSSGAEVIRSLSWSPLTSTWEAVPLMKRGFIMCEGMAILNHLVSEGEVVRAVGADGVFRYSKRLQSQYALAC